MIVKGIILNDSKSSARAALSTALSLQPVLNVFVLTYREAPRSIPSMNGIIPALLGLRLPAAPVQPNRNHLLMKVSSEVPI